MHDPFKRLYKLSKTGALLQTKDLSKSEEVFKKIDEEVNFLKNKGNLKLSCRNKIYDLPVKVTPEIYLRPFFKMHTHRVIKEAKADDTNALDLDVPLGTEVYAVESGIVTAMQSGITVGGKDKKYSGLDNYLYIYNKESNLIFCYRHLDDYKNILPNMYINKGDLIGRVALTGYVITPHLHFVIYEYKHNDKIKLKSLKIKFV